MKINCHTNLDLYPYEQFPKNLICRPMKGDIITSNTGLELEVVRVVFKDVKRTQAPVFSDLQPIEITENICNVELHLPPHRFANITQFEKWYKNRKIKG